jgi:hypothetical protein
MIVVGAVVKHFVMCGWTDVLIFNCTQTMEVRAVTCCVYVWQLWKLIPASA